MSNYRDVNEALPILMVRGSEDPCTGYEKGAKDSVDTLKQAGFSNISTITYPHMRHEILNEKENEKVYADVVTVHDFDGYPMGKGFINQNSKIRIRMLTRHADQEINENFLRMRVKNAWEYRKTAIRN